MVAENKSVEYIKLKKLRTTLKLRIIHKRLLKRRMKKIQQFPKSNLEMEN